MVILLLCFAALTAAAQPERLFLGDASHPIPNGEAWLIANRWGATPAVLVGTIRNGILEKREIQSFPQYWEQAFEYRLLIGGSDSPMPPPQRNETDWGYGLDSPDDYLKRFQYFFLSPPFAKDWVAELNRIGAIVPRPVRRTIRFLNMDGNPLTAANIVVSVFGSNRSHCGFAGGIKVGTFLTDAEGRISFVAPPSPLAIAYRYSEEQTGGPAGLAFAFRNDLITGSERDMTLRKWWTLPAYDYSVTVRPARPGIRADACLFDIPCGAGCGPVIRANSLRVTNGAGVLRFRARDLREMEHVTLVDSEGDERALTEAEMRELLTAHHVTIAWNSK
jgi:hypothetical protein